MKMNKLRKIQDLIIMIDINGENLKFETRDILYAYNLWTNEVEDLDFLIKKVNSTLKIAKKFEKNLIELKKLLKEMRKNEGSNHNHNKNI
jgi:hypothetical protein